MRSANPKTWAVVATSAAVGACLIAALGTRLHAPPLAAVNLVERGDRLAGAAALSLEKVASSSCDSCHRFEPALSHPVRVRADARPNLSLPLEQGLVTCITCHAATPDHATSGARVGVRVPSPGLCAQCHSTQAPSTAGVHASLRVAAHLGTHPQARGAAGQGLDAESRTCMTCHDGVAGTDAGMPGSRRGAEAFGKEHPVGVRVAGAVGTGGTDFRLSRRSDQRIRLFNGAIGCGSCHSVYSHEPGKLVMSNQRSQLCLSCHTQR